MVPRTMRAVLLGGLLALPLGLSGCLGDDIWREPFVWNEVGRFGENPDAAQAFAAGLAGLAPHVQEQGDVVVQTARDLPDNVVFQNARDFLNSQSPGAGDQVHGGVRVVVDTATDSYVELTGEAAAVYEQATGPLLGTTAPQVFQVAPRATQIRWTLDVVLTGQQPPEPDQNPLPFGVVTVRIVAPGGAVMADYRLDTTRQVLDQAFRGTWGDRNEVRAHFGGTWQVEVHASAEGAWSLVVEAYEPKYEDFRHWQFWRAERRRVTGE